MALPPTPGPPRPPGPLVSVIIPTRDRLGVVREAVASVLAQTHRELELIVVDDGSTDGTWEWVAGVEGVRALRTEGLGSGAARNAGLAVAQGELIASLDSDDVWAPTFLARTVEALEAHDADIAFTNWHPGERRDIGLEGPLSVGTFGRTGPPGPDGWTVMEPAQARAVVLELCPAPSSALLLRRAAIASGWSPDVRIGDDWGLLLECVLHRPCRMVFTRERLWRKGYDATNQHDGLLWDTLARELWWHDHGVLLREHGALMTPAERRRWSRRRWEWGGRLVGSRVKRALRKARPRAVRG